MLVRAVPALRRRRSRTKVKRRRSKPRLSILTVGGMVGGALGSLSNKTSIAESVMRAVSGQSKWSDVGQVVVRETIGYDIVDKTWQLPTFTTLTLAGAVGSKVANKFVKPSTFNGIPFVGKRIKL